MKDNIHVLQSYQSDHSINFVASWIQNTCCHVKITLGSILSNMYIFMANLLYTCTVLYEFTPRSIILADS